MKTGAQYWLESSSFLAEPGEDEETNPGVFGKAFADWIAARLRETGYACEAIVPEDWAWFVVVRYRPYMVAIACHCGDGESSPEPKLSEWSATVIAWPSLFQRLFRRSEVDAEIKSLSFWLEKELRNAPGAVRTWIG